jgi:uncharacterized Zn-binding protein involved in type VI secretion
MSGKLIARKGDKHDCPIHGEGEIIDGWDGQIVEGLPVARVGDRVRCPDGSIAIIEDNNCCMEAGDKKIARVGDKTSHGGTITTGASSVTADDGDLCIFFGSGVEIGENVHFDSYSDDSAFELVNTPDDFINGPGSGRVESVAPELFFIGGRLLISGLFKLGEAVFGKKIFEKNAQHIFRESKKGGHFTKDSLEARKKIIEVASNKKNYLGPDKHGNQWYGKTQSNGSQVWAQVRDGQIRAGGINKPPKPYDPKTGLSSSTRPINAKKGG